MLDVKNLSFGVDEAEGTILLHYGPIGVEVANSFDEFQQFKKSLFEKLNKIEREMRDQYFPNREERDA